MLNDKSKEGITEAQNKGVDFLAIASLRNLCQVLLIIIVCSGCGDDPIDQSIEDTGLRNYIFLGHIYKNPTSIDDRLVSIDYDQYDQVWLGGDVCSETTSDLSTIQYLDDIFDLSSQRTLWTLGNHDIRNGNLDYITNATGRETFYTSHLDNITFLVLNTTLGHSGTYDTLEVKQQLDLIATVCDTIEQSTHLVVLSHHVVWKDADPSQNIYAISNGGGPGVLFDIAPDKTYDDVIYPMFVSVQERGIQVIHIAGDLGQKVATYEHTTLDGIQLLGSGISSNTEYHSQFPTHGIPDSILTLQHDINVGLIEWKFEELN